jgi:hypothetical protein
MGRTAQVPAVLRLAHEQNRTGRDHACVVPREIPASALRTTTQAIARRRCEGVLRYCGNTTVLRSSGKQLPLRYACPSLCG